MIYLDSAATTLQKPPAVSKAVADAVGSMASPGRGGHRPAMLAAELMFRCRQAAAELFDVPTAENVVFTSNATPCRGTRVSTALKAPDCSSADNWESLCFAAERGVFPCIRKCPIFYPTEWKRELKTSAE